MYAPEDLFYILANSALSDISSGSLLFAKVSRMVQRLKTMRDIGQLVLEDFQRCLA